MDLDGHRTLAMSLIGASLLNTTIPPSAKTRPLATARDTAAR